MALRTINEHAAWTAVLEVLNVPVAGRALPARTTCPLCQGGRLTIYEDTILGGAWHYCFDCHAAGDMIELASAVWELSPQAALTKLSSLGVGIPAEQLEPATVAKYVTNHPQMRNRLRDLWRRCQEYLAATPSAELTQLKQRFRLEHHLSPERWQQGPGNLLGGCAIDTAALAFGLDLQRNKYKVFKGGGWGEALAIPFHDLPDRICGFLFIGREGGNKDRVFLTPGGYTYGRKSKPEAGLAGLWTVDASKASFGPHVFVVDDVLLALRLQMRHFASSTRPLPLLAWYTGPRAATRQAWWCLDSRAPIFWCWKMEAKMLDQAMRANGQVALTPLEGPVNEYIRKVEPSDLLRKALKRARPWKEALKNWVETATDAAVEEVLVGLGMLGHDTQALISFCPRIGELLCVPAAPPQVRVGGWMVMEQNGQWWGHHYRYKQKVCIMNARLRIDGVLVKDAETYSGKTRKHDVVHYKGRLLYEGEEIPFEIPTTVMDHRPATALTKLLAKAKGRMLYIATGWAGRLIQLANLFQTPGSAPEWPS